MYQLRLQIPDLSKFPKTGDRLVLLIHGSDPVHAYSQIYEQRVISVREQPDKIDKHYAFVQTDQPLYKAKDTVRFRIVTVDQKLLPNRIPLNVRILDPQNNIVKLYANVTGHDGYFAGDHLLSSEPILGAWTIEARSYGSQNLVGRKQFFVEEYVLPRFDIKILSLPRYVTPIDSELRFLVEANYTFGEPVKGTLKATWKMVRNNEDQENNGNTITADFNGRSSVSLPIRSAVSRDVDYSADDKLEIKVNFTEALTGQSKITIGYVSVSNIAYKVELLGNADKFTPGLPYRFRARVSDLDGRPLPLTRKKITIDYSFYDKRASWGNRVVVKSMRFNDYNLDENDEDYFTLEYPERRPQSGEILQLGIPANGIVDVSIPTTRYARRIELNVKYLDDQKRYTVKGKESPSSSFLEIEPLSGDLHMGDMTSFGINTTTRTDETIHFIVQSNSNDSFLWSNSTSAAGSYVTISVQFLEAMGFDVRLTVYYIRSDDEIVGNILPLTLTRSPAKNDVVVSVDATNGLEHVHPGQKVVLKAKTSPSSFVAFLAMDESLLLLKTGNDLSYGEINAATDRKVSAIPLSDLYSVKDYFKKAYTEQFVLTNYELPSSDEMPMYFSSASNPSHYRQARILSGAPMFSEAIGDYADDTLIAGDYDDMQRANRISGRHRHNQQPSASAESFDRTTHPRDKNPTDKLQSPTQNRNNFRQSFLFETAVSNSDGFALIQSKVPDSITTWKVTAFSINNATGLGLTSVPTRLKVFQPFFAVLNLPFSIVRYENLTAEILIFNYMSQEQDVKVKLEIRNPDNSTHILRKIVAAKPNDGITAAFNIIPQQIGDLDLKVTVQCALAADQLEKTLTVKPEGVRQYYSYPVFIDLRQSSNLDLVVRLPVDPVGKVVGSDKVEVRVVGDILGAAMNNLDKLIRLPTGCGEQNMATTTPNLVVAKYLKQLNQLSETQRLKLVSNMQLGYQQELTFRHTDGSYSAWGNFDPIGSTWLTAYVVRVFSEATEFVPSIEENVIKSGVRFLINLQKEDGSFEEKGKVIDKQHQGGASAGTALTSFTLLSLLQYRNASTESWAQTNASIRNATIFLESKLQTLSNDAYSLAITAYALAKAGSVKSSPAVALLEQRMVTNASVAYWTTVASLSDQGADVEHSYPTNAKDIETTAYALLAFLANNKFSMALPIVSWLISKQNSEGGFVSTADTVVGLTGLAEFAKAFISSPSMQIDINYDRNKQTVSLIPETAVVLHNIELGKKPRSINLRAQGRGVAIAYLSWTYHVAKPAEDIAFDLNVTRAASATDLRMGICSRYIREGSSGMAVIEVNALSGYQFDEDEIRKLVKTVSTLRKTEVSDKETKLNLYFDQLEQSPTCFKLTLYRTYKVKDIKDQSIVVYDYYNPKERRTVSYNLF
ncbi:CD109 antigen-like [Paramacrobiotus metropolitanus]|uniref:CD109 antigen-like n=1 Tax=Paramacrobiotus metropolitanus TaxID=2943436 RepID=UPI0024456F97|nr:CD109 antigen-like [Paramacrobiotus metropolitanus]